MTANIFRPIKIGNEIFHAKSFDDYSFVMDWTLGAGGKVPTHQHKFSDEHFLVTKGEILFIVNGKKVVKKEGDEISIPMTTPHSVANATKNDIAATVTYSPLADNHRMFEIISTLDEIKPATMKTLMQTLFIMERLKLKTFSNPHPAFIIHSDLNNAA